MLSFNKIIVLLLVATLLCATVTCEVYFYEGFPDKNWKNRWVLSKAKGDYGDWKWTAGDWYGDAEYDKGLQASQDARFYAISAKFDKMFDNKDKTTIIQYAVKMPQGIDCGGAYIKILPDGINQNKFSGDTEYNIMFGPDICGATKKVHFIFSYKGKNLLWKKNLACKTDKLTHIYTAIINPNNTYSVLVDGDEMESGSLYEDWDFLPPKKIPDPNAVKPADWVDEKEIPDVNDVKPADWDSEPQFINDPDAKQPEDWNEEEDGKWEPPKIPNPAYKGEWVQRKIPNPAYKGEWKAPEIDNPEYVHDELLYHYPKMNYVGIDIWQVKSGTIFDDILVTDDEAVAEKYREKKKANMELEKEMFEQLEADRKKKDEERRKEMEEERKKREEARKKKKDEDEDENVKDEL
jgi:calreticulin